MQGEQREVFFASLPTVPPLKSDDWYAGVEEEVVRKTRVWFFAREWAFGGYRGPDAITKMDFPAIYGGVVQAHRGAAKAKKTLCPFGHTCVMANASEALCNDFVETRCFLAQILQEMLTLVHACAYAPEPTKESVAWFNHLPVEMLREIQSHLTPSDALAWRLAHPAVARQLTPPALVLPFGQHPLWDGHLDDDLGTRLVVESDPLRLLQWLQWGCAQYMAGRAVRAVPRSIFFAVGAFASVPLLRFMIRLQLWGLVIPNHGDFYSSEKGIPWRRLVYGALAVGRGDLGNLTKGRRCLWDAVFDTPLSTAVCNGRGDEMPLTPMASLMYAEARGFVPRHRSAMASVDEWDQDIRSQYRHDYAKTLKMRNDIAEACIVLGREDVLAKYPSCCSGLHWPRVLPKVQTDRGLRWLTQHQPQDLPPTLPWETIQELVVMDKPLVLDWLVERQYVKPRDFPRLMSLLPDDRTGPEMMWLKQHLS